DLLAVPLLGDAGRGRLQLLLRHDRLLGRRLGVRHGHRDRGHGRGHGGRHLHLRRRRILRERRRRGQVTHLHLHDRDRLLLGGHDEVHHEHQQEHADDRADADPGGAEHVPLRHLHELGRPVGHELVETDAFFRRIGRAHSFSTSAFSLSSRGLMEKRVNLAPCSSSSMSTMFANSASRSTLTTTMSSFWFTNGLSTSLTCATDERFQGFSLAPRRQYSRPSARTRIVSVFDSGTSVFRSFGGRLISSALGVRNTVVTMKKMSSRNATSTIGVMSMRMPSRRFLRETAKPFFLPPPLRLSGVSTAPMLYHRPSCGLT